MHSLLNTQYTIVWCGWATDLQKQCLRQEIWLALYQNIHSIIMWLMIHEWPIISVHSTQRTLQKRGLYIIRFKLCRTWFCGSATNSSDKTRPFNIYCMLESAKCTIPNTHLSAKPCAHWCWNFVTHQYNVLHTRVHVHRTFTFTVSCKFGRYVY